MKNYTLEINYGINVTLNIESNSHEEAIKKAKEIINKGVRVTEDCSIDDVSELFFNGVNYINEENK